MHANGEEGGTWILEGLGMQARAVQLQLVGCVETNEEVIALVQEKRKRRSIKESRGKGAEE